ncbi:MAG: hypothetical protein IPK37_02205 [Austwickia sp.]|jgi:hypothetical protein|nr:MAG: hypothetical protein IPK37_02205 [Austwickia sp.]
MSQVTGSGRDVPLPPDRPATLVAPGPLPSPQRGPLYGARYGDPAYEARFGTGAAVSAPLGGPSSPPSLAGAIGAPGIRRAAAGRLTFRPGVVTLRPASLGDLLDGAVRTIRLRPGLFLGVGALAVLVGTVLRAVIDALVGVTIVGPDGTAAVRITPSLALVPVMAALLSAVLALPTAEAVLGRAPTVARLRTQLRPRARAVAGYVTLAAVACLVPTLLIWFALGGRAAQQSDLLLALVVLGFVAELVSLPLFAAPAAVVLEGAGPWQAIRRSVRLVRGYLGRTLAVALLARLLVLLVTTALATPLAVAVAVASATSGFSLDETLLGPALSTLFGMLTACLTLPFEATLRSLYYVDVRVRAEGLDVLLVDAARRGEP